jgi:hypothetical protein
MKPNPKKRRRSCADKMRHRLMERQRQRRGGDPAGKVALQLLGILSAFLAVMPPIPEFSLSLRSRRPGGLPAPSRDSKSSSSGKANLDYLDDEDRGPTAYAMERGIDLIHYPTTSRVAPTWSRLVKDSKRNRSAARARELLEHRVPAGAVEWLRSRIYAEDWMSLRLLGLNASTDDEIATAALREANRWKAAQPKPPETAQHPDTEPAVDDPEDTKGPKT